jgi:hypothetical protein
MNTCNIIAGDWEIVNEKAQDYVKKSHNVAKNVAQRNSQDLERVADTSKTLDHIVDTTEKVSLTEQWKKGELEAGIYYIKTKDGIENDGFDGKEFGFFSDMEIDQILGKVPSYEEWQELSKQRNQLIRDVKDLAYIQEENQRLKDLLKECYKMLAQYHIENSEPSLGENIQLLTKLDEVLK